MKNWFVLACLWLVCFVMGCDEAESMVAPAMVDSGIDADLGCVPEVVVETLLPTIDGDVVHTFCSTCDGLQCDSYGEPCAKYGGLCESDSGVSVCVTCCNGVDAGLRCSKGG